LGDDGDEAVPLCKVYLVYLRRFQGNSLTVRREIGDGNKPYKPFEHRNLGPRRSELS
jgi:hypothetical protein